MRNNTILAAALALVLVGCSKGGDNNQSKPEGAAATQAGQEQSEATKSAANDATIPQDFANASPEASTAPSTTQESATMPEGAPAAQPSESAPAAQPSEQPAAFHGQGSALLVSDHAATTEESQLKKDGDKKDDKHSRAKKPSQSAAAQTPAQDALAANQTQEAASNTISVIE